MANKIIKKPLAQRVSIYEQECELRLKAKELLKKIKDAKANSQAKQR